MLHITRISSVVPKSKGSKDYLMTAVFSNGNVKTMVLTATAHADLLKHLQAITDPPPKDQPKKKSTKTKAPSKTT